MELVTFTCLLVAFGTFLHYILYPLVRFISTKRHIHRVLMENFPESYEGKFHWLYGHVHCHPKPGPASLERNAELLERCPKARIFYFGSLSPNLILSHPDTAKAILQTGQPKRKLSRKLLGSWIGNGLIFSQGSKWQRNRKLLTPAFHFDILKPYIKIYNICIEKLIAKLEVAANEDRSVEVLDQFSLCTFEIIMKCAFTSPDEFQKEENLSYVNAVFTILSLILKRLFSPLLHLDWIYYRTTDGKESARCSQLCRNEALKIIDQRRAIIRKHGEEALTRDRKYVDFLDILLLAKDAEGNGMTDEEIIDEVQTFMFAGMDTTKTAISFLLYNLARHPEIQANARKEVATLLQGRESSEILWEDLSKMEYLSKCIKESLRLHPPVPAIGRQLEDDLVIDGRPVLAGTGLQVWIWDIHHNPLVWGENHMTFDPERFEPERISKMDPFAFVPFSAGPRNCIGQNFAMNEIKVAVARIINKFDIEVDESIPVELKPDIVLSTLRGIHLKFNVI